MDRIRLGLALVALLVAAPALAVSKGGTLYVKNKEAKLLEKPDASAKVLVQLKPGEAVIWNGAAPENKQFHAIDAGGKKGFTLQQNLSPNKPAAEFLAKDDGKPIDPQAFASSGAATKALSEAALKFSEARAKEKPNVVQLTKGVMTAEGIAKTVSKDDASKFVVSRTGGGK
jgi:hypothetical protein